MKTWERKHNHKLESIRYFFRGWCVSHMEPDPHIPLLSGRFLEHQSSADEEAESGTGDWPRCAWQDSKRL